MNPSRKRLRRLRLLGLSGLSELVKLATLFWGWANVSATSAGLALEIVGLDWSRKSRD